MGFFHRKPKWQSRSALKRCFAVPEIDDPNILAKLVMEDTSIDVREAAVNRLEEETLLLKVALSNTFIPIHVRSIAIGKIKNQAYLKQIVESNLGEGYIELALKKITDKAYLQNLLEDDASTVDKDVLMNILSDDEALLTRMEHAAPEEAAQLFAKWKPHIRKLDTLAKIALRYENISEAAFSLLQDKLIMEGLNYRELTYASKRYLSDHKNKIGHAALCPLAESPEFLHDFEVLKEEVRDLGHSDDDDMKATKKFIKVHQKCRNCGFEETDSYIR